MKHLFLALLAFIGFGYAAAAQEPPKTKQKPKTLAPVKTRKPESGGVKRIDTAAAPIDVKKSKEKTKDTVVVNNKK